MATLFRLIQFSDSTLPVGTFSFSNGLETASHLGLVHDAATLESYTRSVATQAAYSDGVAALLAWRAARAGDYEGICRADRQLLLFKMNGSGATPGTWPVAQGIAFALAGLGEKALYVAHQYGVINMVLSAALRCVRVSHYDTQQILFTLGGEVESMYTKAATMGFENMNAFVPEMDILASLHEKGTMRMFMN